MASAPLFDAGTVADRWVAAYCNGVAQGDVMCGSGADARDPAWSAMLEELAAAAGDSLEVARERAQRQAEDIGTGFRIPGESEERPWPLSPIPLMIPVDEWRGIAAGVMQRAELMERILVDLYGEARLVADGHLPAAVVAGSPFFLRPMVGLVPPGGRHLNFVAFDLCRDPSGQWRVLADHLRAPAGAGYALENRLATSRVIGGLQTRLNIERHAPFFAAFRDGLAAACHRAEPRIGLLTPGRLNQSYAEQAHLARYLGLLLVEGADLTVIEDRLYVRTVAGMKRVDALWRRVDPRLIDPLAFDSRSQIGVPGLIDAMAAGEVVIANAPGAGVLESPAFAAFLPGVAAALMGEPLSLPSIATWWCGGDDALAHTRAHLDDLLISSAFATATLGLPMNKPSIGADLSPQARERLLRDLELRPMDYVAQEVIRLSTMPAVADGAMVPRPFTLRVFVARDAAGAWTVLPGGFAQIGEQPDVRAAVVGEGQWSADVVVHGDTPVEQVSLLPTSDNVAIRRNPGTLPSRVADNLYWLGRYLERGEGLLAAIRVLLGNSITADTGAALPEGSVRRLANLIAGRGAAPFPATTKRQELTQLARTALDAEDGWYSVRKINAQARGIGDGSRDRLSADMIRLLDAPWPAKGSMLDRAGSLQRRYAALIGLSAEHMVRTDAWRFHALGRRVERASNIAGVLRAFGHRDASLDDLSTLLDLADSQISYRQRYIGGMAWAPVIDLVALDPGNPRGISYQVERIAEHLRALPRLKDDGMAEPQEVAAAELAAMVSTAKAGAIDETWIGGIETQLGALNEAVARRFFLQGSEPMRPAGLTLA